MSPLNVPIQAGNCCTVLCFTKHDDGFYKFVKSFIQGLLLDCVKLLANFFFFHVNSFLQVLTQDTQSFCFFFFHLIVDCGFNMLQHTVNTAVYLPEIQSHPNAGILTENFVLDPSISACEE